MHVIVMGCGRVGVALASKLSADGHFVSIIDRDSAAFRALPKDFKGQVVKGVGFDLDTLREAGIEESDAFIAVSSGDNSNIISARVAREKFGVSKVIARIYDPKRAEIYSRLGIPTIASVTWSTQQIISLLSPSDRQIIWTDATKSTQIAQFTVPKVLVTKQVSELENIYAIKVVSISRNSKSFLAKANDVLQEQDIINIAYLSQDSARLEELFSKKEESL